LPLWKGPFRRPTTLLSIPMWTDRNEIRVREDNRMSQGKPKPRNSRLVVRQLSVIDRALREPRDDRAGKTIKMQSLLFWGLNCPFCPHRPGSINSLSFRHSWSPRQGKPWRKGASRINYWNLPHNIVLTQMMGENLLYIQRQSWNRQREDRL
jgi:hypothetical protein